MQDLRKKAHIEENLALLDQVEIDLPDAGASEKNRPAKPGTVPSPSGAAK
jgi:hypothetical protein